MKHRIAFILSMAIVVSILCTLGCSAPSAPAPASPSTPAPSTPPAQPITLKLGSDSVPAAYFNKAADWWVKEVVKATDGRVKIDQYHNSSIAKMNTSLEALVGGMVDIYILSITGLGPQLPVSQGLCMPGLSFPSTLEGKVASCNNYAPIIEKYPSMANEWKNVKILYSNPGPTFHIITRGKEIHTPQDIVGVKIGALGSRQDLMKILGAAPVAAPPPQAYEMMQNGVVEAFCMPWVAVNDFQLWEVAKVQVDADTGESGMVTAISNNSWSKISPQDQKIIMDISAKAPPKSAEFLLADQQAAMNKFSEYKRTMITLTKEERALWQEKSKGYWDEWVAKEEGRGAKGLKDILNDRKAASDAAWAK